jgi:hypothetical protein
MTSFFFKEWLSFKKFVLNDIFQGNLLILDGRGSHVIIEAIEQLIEFRLDTTTLPSHTLHILQPLHVFLSKSFKIAFRRAKDSTMARNNYTEFNKVTLAGWLTKALEKCLNKQNIKSRFGVIIIFPLKPIAKVEKKVQM